MNSRSNCKTLSIVEWEKCEECPNDQSLTLPKLARTTSRGDLWPGVSKKEYIFDPSDFRRLRLHETIFKGFDGESVIGPAKIFLKPYWKERSVSYFEEEGR
jgi:hypothetical protein